jgi:hypothetical protein
MFQSLARRPFLLLVALYAFIAAVFALAYVFLPPPFHRAFDALTGAEGLGVASGMNLEHGVTMLPGNVSLWLVATVAMTGAGLLGLPVAWLYTITRHKRGYRQSLVHSLVLLPVVVAGVVVLVKFSLALAFSLAGTVAAVRFRHTIEDSKDSIYIFVATGIGLAAGVELTAAAALSVMFNIVSLLLFHSDFGRTPARLEGERAQERLQRALAVANRTSQFVARLDDEILKAMAPEQLEALADRAWRRRKSAGAEAAEALGGVPDKTLAIVTDDLTHTREIVEEILARRAKRWHFKGSSVAPDGTQRIEYTVRLKKSVPPPVLIEEVRAAGAPHLRDVELK